MCGIVGVIIADEKQHCVSDLIDALTSLQHRGQDAAGIVTSEVFQKTTPNLHLHKNNGLVRDVFKPWQILELKGHMGIGHVRYPTAGSSSCAEAQPFYTNMPFGVCLAHNGNLTNAAALAVENSAMRLRHVNTGSDSEVILNVFADALMSRMLGKRQAIDLGFVDNSAAYTKWQTPDGSTPRKKHRNDLQLEIKRNDGLGISPDDVFYAVTQLMGQCRGGYACTVLINGFGLLAFRDPWGIRPCVFGTRARGDGKFDHMVASESVALDVLGYRMERDIAPGEALWVTCDGTRHTMTCCNQSTNGVIPSMRSCIFEYVYFARPDSILDGISVYQARLEMGNKLADKILVERPNHDIDVVVPVPDTSRTSALQLANKLGVIYREGFIKNRYIARTFIMPGQKKRRKSVRQKMNPIGLEFKDRVVLLVDDSIVRGTTATEIVQMARDAGAKKVYLASAAPAICHPNVYGIDMPSREELVAHNRTPEQVAQRLKCDWVIYQDLPDLVDSVNSAIPAETITPPAETPSSPTSPTSPPNTPPPFDLGSPRIYETSVFDGIYVTKDIDEEYFVNLHKKRNDAAKANGKEEEEKDSDSNEPSTRKRKLALGRQPSNDVTNGMLMSISNSNS